MPELIAKSALDGRSLTVGSVTLAEVDVGSITSIAALPGGGAALAKGLKALGLAMPRPNAMHEGEDARILWTGRDQAFLIGVGAPALEGAAVADQSDGWAVLSLSGAATLEVLARHLPVDLRVSAFPVGQVLRTQLNHMNAIVLRTEATAFQIMVFRSMARTAWHELEDAMHMVAARSGTKI